MGCEISNTSEHQCELCSVKVLKEEKRMMQRGCQRQEDKWSPGDKTLHCQPSVCNVLGPTRSMAIQTLKSRSALSITWSSVDSSSSLHVKWSIISGSSRNMLHNVLLHNGVKFCLTAIRILNEKPQGHRASSMWPVV
ncbi:unnamed protein product [Pleuronectes platessa]|uniref:Uncharacterized protein n=1 Tax=Pleuronectes platessa TaxID=8262 RepID=A0A9N7YLT7_PLEPL|nr:unnamed protein product [Pleuronectes platessa]